MKTQVYYDVAVEFSKDRDAFVFNSLKTLLFSLSVSFHHFSIPIFIVKLLFLEGQGVQLGNI